MDDKSSLMHGDVTALIIKSFFEVHRELGGFGYLEIVYKRALAIAMRDNELGCDIEVPMKVSFRGQVVGNYCADFIVNKCVIVEVKTGLKIYENHQTQTYNYLKASNLNVALILNFGLKAEFERCYLDTHTRGRDASV